MKKILYTAFYFCSALLLSSCIGDLDQYPHEDETSSTIYTNAENYKAVLGKIYAAMVTTGQEKGGDPDLSSNSGQDYMRCFFNLQECGTDEVASTWLSGDNVSGLTYLSWDAEENCIDGEPKIWQHDIFFDNLEPYSKLEAGIIKELTQNENIKIRIPIREMTHELMDELENKGLILRLYPSHHRNIVDLDKSVGKDIYISSKKAGAHKLLSVTINRTDFSAFGMHDENEEVLLIGGEGEKDLFILFGLGTWDSFMKKKKEKTLCEDDFICVHCKYNDPFVSFFTICKGVLHGEAVAGEMGMPATFYVTEPSDIKLMIFPFNNYKITF